MFLDCPTIIIAYNNADSMTNEYSLTQKVTVSFKEEISMISADFVNHASYTKH